MVRATTDFGRVADMERSELFDHLRRTHFESGDRRLAVTHAKRIAQLLRARGADRVVGIGSAFDRERPFTRRSDIDIVARNRAGALLRRVGGSGCPYPLLPGPDAARIRNAGPQARR